MRPIHRPNVLRSLRLAASWGTATALGLFLALPVGCQSDPEEKKDLPPEVERPEVTPNPLPRYLRGTIRYEAELRGYRPTFVSGYGIVVGLQGTGSSDTPIPIRANLEREASRLLEDNRITSETQLTIQDILNSKNTSVVFVEGSIPPGAPAGTTFDVKVSALPSTSTTSLEGGRLWTVKMQRGIVSPTGPLRDAVAQARGDVLINPFVSLRVPTRPSDDPDTAPALASPEPAPQDSADSSAAPSDSPPKLEDPGLVLPPAEPSPRGSDVDVDFRVGRILNGGATTEDMPLVVTLSTPNFSRARAIADAINQRFAREPGQNGPTAVPVQGRTDEQLQIFVPPSWSTRTDDFVQILMHTPIQRAAADRYANNLVTWVKESPIDASEICWIWVGIGEPALPAIQSLYTYSEAVPRIAALKAGAKLGDPLAVRPLAEVAANAESGIRVNAIELLGELGAGSTNVRVSAALRPLLDDDDLSVRLAAFEALDKIRDPSVRRVPRGEIDGFDLCTVPSIKPLIYVTQQKAPRIVLFGPDQAISRPVIASAWDDRLMVIGESSFDPLRVFYRPVGDAEGQTYEVPSDLISFIRFLGAAEKPLSGEAGLGLSYAETLGALYALNQGKAIAAPLVAERDQLTARILSGRRGERPLARPETELSGEGQPATPSSEGAQEPDPAADPAASDDQPDR